MNTIPLWVAEPLLGEAHPELKAHLASEFGRTCAYDETRECYRYERWNRTVYAGGLLSKLKALYYPHHQRRQRRRRTQRQGSSRATGQLVDAQISAYIAHQEPWETQPPLPGQRRVRRNRLTRAILAHWETAGHRAVAAQVPVRIGAWERVTQADCLTRDADGRLWLWEVKTGDPPGGYRRQGAMRNICTAKDKVWCTVYNQWQLQLYYTRAALQEAGVLVHEARIIQAFVKRVKGKGRVICREIPLAPWTQRLSMDANPQKVWRPRAKRKKEQ